MSIGTASIGGQVISVETQSGLMQMGQRVRLRAGREMLLVSQLPPGKFYCLWCKWPDFVIPVDGVDVEIPDYCQDCVFLIQVGVGVERK